MLLSQTRLRQILGVMWIIDGLLQLQPQMFTMNMINGVMAPLSQGQPGLIGQNLHWITQITTENLTLVNIVITVVQVAIGVLLVTGVYVRQAVIVSMAWALVVWYGGEGMSLLLTGQASVLTGAPGAVLLYPVLGLAVYPRDRSGGLTRQRDYAGLLDRRMLRLILGALWIFFGLLQLQPYWWNRGRIDDAVSAMTGMGGWNTQLIDPTLRALAGMFASSEVLANMVVILVCFALGIGILISPERRLPIILGVAIVMSFLLWWFAEAFGGILTGMSTDFNSGLPLIVLALACWPGVARAKVTVPSIRAQAAHPSAQ